MRVGQVSARHHHSVLLCNYRLMQQGQSECGGFGGDGCGDVIGLDLFFLKKSISDETCDFSPRPRPGFANT